MENKILLLSGTALLQKLGFSSLASLIYFTVTSYAARAVSGNHEETVFEVRGGRRVELVPDYAKDEFLVADKMSPWWIKRGNSATLLNLGDVWSKCVNIASRLLLPEGYPDSVTSDYLEYSLWRGVQGVAAQISGVLATQVMNFLITVFVVFGIFMKTVHNFLLVSEVDFCCCLSIYRLCFMLLDWERGRFLQQRLLIGSSRMGLGI